jgi:hypothetical protein
VLDAWTTRLRILACAPAYQDKDHRFTIYEVRAERENGEPVSEKLRCFSSLPIGTLVDVTVREHVSHEHGRSFMLYAADGLLERVSALEGLVAGLLRRVEELEGP